MRFHFLTLLVLMGGAIAACDAGGSGGASGVRVSGSAGKPTIAPDDEVRLKEAKASGCPAAAAFLATGKGTLEKSDILVQARKRHAASEADLIKWTNQFMAFADANADSKITMKEYFAAAEKLPRSCSGKKM